MSGVGGRSHYILCFVKKTIQNVVKMLQKTSRLAIISFVSFSELEMHLAVFRIQKWSNCESRLFIANWKDKTIRKKIGLGFYRDF